MAIMKESVSYQEACVLLGLSWKAFRTLLADYSDVLGEQPANIPPRHVSVPAFERLQVIAEMQRAGEPPESILEALKEMGPAGMAAADETVEGEAGDHGEAERAGQTDKGLEAGGGVVEDIEDVRDTEPGDRAAEEEIAAATEVAEGEAPRPFAAAPEDLRALAALVADLAKQVTRLEETLATERHRSVTAIARLQQELQEVRYAAVTGLSRKDRRRKKPGGGLFGHVREGD